MEFHDHASPLPRKFADFDLLELVSHGGMGVVYKAYQHRLHKIVAIKMLLLGPHASAELIRRFRIEAVSAGSLNHPNIVRVYDVGLHEGQHYIVMDYVDGQNLADLVKDCPIAPACAARYLLKISQAIDYAHSHGVLHRDIKPSNVLLGADDEPRVTDFGLAKRFGDQVSNTVYGTVTADGQVLGSPGFMSPEQARGVHARVGPWSDVYSLGALLYHQLTGRAPFVGASVPETLGMVCAQDPVSPRLLNPAVPRDLETICLKCLEKEPEKRYSAAREVADELSRFGRDEPIVARPAGRTEKVWRWCRRKPQLSSAIATAAVLFFAGFGVSLGQWYRAEDRAAASQLNLYVSDMNRAHDALSEDDRAAALRMLLRHRPQQGGKDLRGWEWRFMWQLCQANNHATIPGDDSVHAVKVSPDGAWIAVARVDGRTTIYNSTTRLAVKTNVAAHYKYAQIPIGFSPNGELLAVASDDVIRILKTGTWNEQQALYTTNADKFFSVIFSASGNEVYATSTGPLHAWSIETGSAIEPPVKWTSDARQISISPDGRWLAVTMGTNVVAMDMVSRTPVFTNVLGSERVASVALSSNGLLAIMDRDGHGRIWDLKSIEGTCAARELRMWQAHPSTVHAVEFSPDERFLATAGNQVVNLWSTQDGIHDATLKGGRTEVWSLGFSPDGSRLFAGGKGGFIDEWNLLKLPGSDFLSGSYYPLWFSDDSDTIATVTHSKRLQLWSTRKRTIISSNALPAGTRAEFVEITPNGKTLLLKTASKVIQVVNRDDGKVRGNLKLDTNRLHAATPRYCAAAGDVVLVEVDRETPGGPTKTLELFNLTSFEPIRLPETISAPACFSVDGKYFAARNADEDAVVFETSTRKRVRLISAGIGVRRTMAFSWDGKMLAVAYSDNMIRVWNASQATVIDTLPGHREEIGRLLFSRDNRTLFSVSTDDALRLWNVATWQELFAVTDYGADTFELLISPDDTVLAVGSIHETRRPVKLYHAPRLLEIDAILAQFVNGVSR